MGKRSQQSNQTKPMRAAAFACAAAAGSILIIRTPSILLGVLLVLVALLSLLAYRTPLLRRT